MLVHRKWLIVKPLPKKLKSITRTQETVGWFWSVCACENDHHAVGAGWRFEFENKIVGGSIPREYIPGVEKGIESVRENGVLGRLPND